MSRYISFIIPRLAGLIFYFWLKLRLPFATYRGGGGGGGSPNNALLSKDFRQLRTILEVVAECYTCNMFARRTLDDKPSSL